MTLFAGLTIALLPSCSQQPGPSTTATTRPSTGTTVLAAITTTTQTAFTPPPPAIPLDTDYRSKLGRYAQAVLGEGAVPYGSIEHLEYLAACIRSAGFDVVLDTQDGSITAQPGSAQVERYQTVRAACEQAAIAGGLVAQPRPPDPETLKAWYAAYRLTFDCLTSHGYPTLPPPSEEVYVASNGQAWHPYDALDGSQIATAERVCTQDLVRLLEQLNGLDQG